MHQNRTNLALGLLLILIGGWLVISRQVPAVSSRGGSLNSVMLE